jgi:hypothetical protein
LYIAEQDFSFIWTPGVEARKLGRCETAFQRRLKQNELHNLASRAPYKFEKTFSSLVASYAALKWVYNVIALVDISPIQDIRSPRYFQTKDDC